MTVRYEGIHVLTVVADLQPGAAVEGRIKELRQRPVGRTAVDDFDGNTLLWSLRSQALSDASRTAGPDRLRTWLYRLPGRFIRQALKTWLQLRHDEPLRGRLLHTLRRIARLRGSPSTAMG